MMAVFEGDPDGWSLAQKGWDAMDKMQARSDDGRMFLPGEYRFPSTQHDTIGMLGLQWLCLHVADPILDAPKTRTGTRHLKSGGLVLHRTAKAFVTLSYGAKVMAQIASMQPDRIVSPDQRSLIGSVYIASENRPPAPKVSMIDIDLEEDMFAAKMLVDHGPKIQALLVFRTDPDGTLHVREELKASEDVTTSRVATGLLGILNNKQWIYETGHRSIRRDDQATLVPAHSGMILKGNLRKIVIDDRLSITSDAPLRAHYAASKGPERGRATDRLYLNFTEGQKAWKAGETISAYRACLRVEE
jgi:hypothetical protein